MWNVFFKEVLEVMRDRRTLIFMLLMPAVVFPALILGYAKIAHNKSQQEGSRELRYALVSPDGAPLLRSVLAKEALLKPSPITSEAAAVTAIQANQLDFALVFDQGGESAIIDGRQPQLSLRYNTATVFDGVGKRIKPLLNIAYTNALRSDRLSQMGIAPDAVAAVGTPFTLKTISTATNRQEQGEQIGALIPYLLFIMGLVASIAVAIDMGAGEKERGTLESLLLLPIARSSVVLAKFLVILSAAVISGGIGITAMGLCASYMMGSPVGDAQSMTQYVQVPELLMLAILILPSYAMVSALLLAISFFARSHKEAATYSQQLTMLVLMPILVSMLPGIKLSDGWAMAPIINSALAIKEVVKGTITMTDLASVVASTTVVAIVLLAISVRWCKREDVLFRS
jgi:sodium transport system permease protein